MDQLLGAFQHLDEKWLQHAVEAGQDVPTLLEVEVPVALAVQAHV